MFCPKILHGCIRTQGWARSRARVRVVVSVIVSVVEACHTAPRLSALPVLSILSVAELVLLCWPTRVAKCYPAGPSRASLNLDKVFEDAKIWTAVFMICFIIFYFHVNGSIGIVQKIDSEIRPNLGCATPKTSRKVVLDNLFVCLCVCLSVLLSVRLAVAFPASSHRRKASPIELKL